MSTEHWENIYQTTEMTSLGWHQDVPQPDFDLVDNLNLDHDAKIVIAGAGISTLVPSLYNEGYSNLVLTDISSTALNKLKKQLPQDAIDMYTWIVDDLTDPDPLQDLDNVDLWVDRAVLHFFTEKADRQAYNQLLEKISPRYLLLAQFSTSGATRCSGLDVYQYDLSRFDNFLGSGYKLQNDLEHIYINPSGGKRPYIYTIYKKVE